MKTSDHLSRSRSRRSFDRLLFESSPSNGGGHKKRPISFRFMQVFVLFLRCITPCSYIYLVLLFWFHPISQFFGNIWLYYIFTLWMFIEAVFFPYYYYLFNSLNVSRSPLAHYASTLEGRHQLIRNCFNAMRYGREDGFDPHIHLRKMMEGWFLGTSIDNIKYDNIASWVSWAFLAKDYKELTKDEYNETVELVSYMEDELKWKFPAGYDDSVHSIRLTLDPLFATQRPFFYYAVISIVNIISHIILFLLGYRKLTNYQNKSLIKNIIKTTIIASQSIYHRKATPNKNGIKKIPVIFVHGIGIGFAHYLAVLISLPSDVDIYLLEWPHVSMQLSSFVPSIDETVSTITSVLDYHNHPKACFLTHSLGSTAVSWMLHNKEVAHRVGATVMLDPVTFLLCDPTVASSFIHREPESTFEFLVHFFVARELHVANALSRHFSWSHNILFVEELPKAKKEGSVVNSIFLSSHDGIIPTASVQRYLEAKRVTGHGSLECLMFSGSHGEMMLYPKWIKLIAQKVKEKCDSVR